MSFDAATCNSKDYLFGFNLYKWGFTSSVNDVFRTSIEATAITIGNFHNYYFGDDDGRTVTFILMKDECFDFKHGHFIKNRGFGASWFCKPADWIVLLKPDTIDLLKRRRWEIESNANQLLIYRIHREIPFIEIDEIIKELESILPDLRQAARSKQRITN